MSRTLRLLRIVAVVLVALFAYSNALDNQFVYDDGAQILRNHYIRDTGHLRQIWTTNVWSFLGPHAVSNYYRPVMHMTYMADYALFRHSPAGYHGTNLLLHILNALLVLALGEALMLPRVAALGGALLFAAHPIGTEAVTWVAGVPELTYALFFLLSLWAYVHGRPPVGMVQGPKSKVQSPAEPRPQAPTEPRLKQVPTESRLKQVPTEPRLKQVPTEPRLKQAAGFAACEKERFQWLWLAVSAIAALLALFSKETALMLLPTIVLYEHLLRGRIGRRFLEERQGQKAGGDARGPRAGEDSRAPQRSILRSLKSAIRNPQSAIASVRSEACNCIYYVPILAAVALYLVMRLRALGSFQVATNPYGMLTLPQHVFSVLYLYGKYVWKLIVPAPFNIFYVFHPAGSLLDWRALAGLAALALLLVAAWRLWRRGQPLAFAFVLLLLPLVPAMDVRAIGHNVFTERYLYLPMAGFCWLLAAAFAYLYSRRTALSVALLALLVANCAVLTRYRNTDWHDDLTLYTRTLITAPEATLIRANLGKTYIDGFGRPDLALAEYLECVRRMPERAEYHLDVGQAYAEMGRYNEAMAAVDRSLVIWDNYPEAFLARGNIYRELLNYDAAELSYRRALEIKPGYAEAHTALGALLRGRGRLAEAEASFRRALDCTELADARLQLGLLQLAQQRYPEAEASLRQTLVSEAHSVLAWYGLGKVLGAQGRSSEATACFRTALTERRWAHPRRMAHPPMPDAAAIERDLATTEYPKSI